MPWAITSWRNSENDHRDNGKPNRLGNSQASALTSTITLGGKARRSPAARLLLKPGESFGAEAPPPLADDLARRVETSGYGVVGKALACQEYDLGSDDVAIW
jgi:hypothetical protein